MQVLGGTEIKPGIKLMDNCGGRGCMKSRVGRQAEVRTIATHSDSCNNHAARDHRLLTVSVLVDGVQTYGVCSRDILVALPYAKGQHNDRQRSAEQALHHWSHSEANLWKNSRVESLLYSPVFPCRQFSSPYRKVAGFPPRIFLLLSPSSLRSGRPRAAQVLGLRQEAMARAPH